jgi:glycogen operon protein
MDDSDWADPSALAIAVYLDGSDDPDRAEDGTLMLDDDFLVLVNAWWEPLDFVLPPTRPDAEWQAEIDSYDPTAPAGAATRHAGVQVSVGPRSVAVFRAAPLPITWGFGGGTGAGRAVSAVPDVSRDGFGATGVLRRGVES